MHTFTVVVTQPPRIIKRFSNDVYTTKPEFPVMSEEMLHYFRDPDGNDFQMTFTASSSDPSIATVEARIAAGTPQGPLWVLRLDAFSVGTATGSITATDVHGLSTTYTFTIKVITGSAPIVMNPIDGVTTEVDDFRTEFPLNLGSEAVFKDFDGDEMTFTTTNDNPDIVSVTVRRSFCAGERCDFLRIDPVNDAGGGIAQASVTAHDGNGNASTEPFYIQVLDGIPPVVANPPPSINQIGGNYPSTRTFLLDDVMFTAPDGDELSYAWEFAESSNNPSDYLDVRIEDVTIPVSPVYSGKALIVSLKQLFYGDIYIWIKARDGLFSDPALNGMPSGYETVTWLGVRNLTLWLKTDEDAGGPSSVSDLPKEFALHDNYPNPFNPTTTIAYDVPEQAHVRIAVYDMLGREVKLLVDRGTAAGKHTVSFDAGSLPSGTYIYRLEAGDFTQVKRMILVK